MIITLYCLIIPDEIEFVKQESRMHDGAKIRFFFCHFVFIKIVIKIVAFDCILDID